MFGIQRLACIVTAFRNYLIMGRAAFDPDGAWKASEALTEFEGLWTYQSRTQILHWWGNRDMKCSEA